jgi:DNA polymerase III gamma/tau subunit
MLNFSKTENIPQSLIVTGMAGNDLSYAVLDKIKKFYQDDLISQRIDHGNFIDIKFIGNNTDSIKVAEIREVSNFLHMSPAEGDFKFVIINNADAMNQNAANSLLKILEEPPKNSYIFLLSFFPGQLLETIRSRCQIAKVDNLKEKKYDSIFRC